MINLIMLLTLFSLGSVDATTHDPNTVFTIINKENSGWILKMHFATSGLLVAAGVDLDQVDSLGWTKETIEQSIKHYLMDHIDIRINKTHQVPLLDFKIGMSVHATEVSFQLGIPSKDNYWDININVLDNDPRTTNYLQIAKTKTQRIYPLTKGNQTISFMHLDNGAFRIIQEDVISQAPAGF